MPAFSILHAVVSIICPMKVPNPMVVRRIQPTYELGKTASHKIGSNDVKCRTNRATRTAMKPTTLKHAIRLNVGIPEI